MCVRAVQDKIAKEMRVLMNPPVIGHELEGGLMRVWAEGIAK